MSEHTLIKGEVDYLHIPYRKDNGFTYCKRCKRFVKKIEIQFNEGWMSDWMQINCGHCKKAIWVFEFPEAEYGKEHKDRGSFRTYIKDDKKCSVCKKPTNHYDCYCNGISFIKKKKQESFILCSKKCDKIYHKVDKKKK